MAERALFVQVPAVNHVLVPRQRGLQLAGNPAPPGRALRRTVHEDLREAASFPGSATAWLDGQGG